MFLALYLFLPQVPERHLELQLLFSERLHFLDEVLEGRLELVPHLSLHLLGVQVVAVVHVLVFAQIRGDLPDFCVKLDVRVAPLTEHDGVLVESSSSVNPVLCTVCIDTSALKQPKTT